MDKFSNLFIIGNGFDLNLGLPTRYTDFIANKSFVDIKLNNYLAKYLNDKHELQKWIDIENELKNYSQRKYRDDASFENFEKDFNTLSNALKYYLSSISYENLNKNSHAYKLLSKLKGNDFLILDFNYTGTVEFILSELGFSRDLIDNRVVKVHGSIKEEEIIFGVEDKAQIFEKHVFLRKAYYKSYKAIDVNLILNEADNIFIFGHSLGETDHMYFDDFFFSHSIRNSAVKGKNIVLFHYDSIGYKELFIQLDALTRNNLTIFKQVNKFKTIDTSK